jgi:hypothetical protein
LQVEEALENSLKYFGVMNARHGPTGRAIRRGPNGQGSIPSLGRRVTLGPVTVWPVTVWPGTLRPVTLLLIDVSLV